jgi:serine/threonine protein kinase
MPGNPDATYAEVAAASAGPPVPPLPFDDVLASRAYTPAVRVLKPVHVPGDDDGDDMGGPEGKVDGLPSKMQMPERPPMGLQRAVSMAGNVLVVLEDQGEPAQGEQDDWPDDEQDDERQGQGHWQDPEKARRAYWIQRKIGKTAYGSVRVGYVLRRREEGAVGKEKDDDDLDSDDGTRARWEVTPVEKKEGASDDTNNGAPPADAAYEMVVIKTYDLGQIIQAASPEPTGGDASGNGPAVEIAVAQLLAQHARTPALHHVLGAVEVLADERTMYMIVPYCHGGDLLSMVESRGRLEEPVARRIFQQLLSALGLYQRVGLCHHDLQPKHVMIHEGDIYVSGKSTCLRIPYGEERKCITEVESDRTRRLIAPQYGQCRQPQYIGPVLLAGTAGFDAHASDLWSAGIILFHMLLGAPPFALASNDDPRFLAISTKGQLAEYVRTWSKDLETPGATGSFLSDDAIDLLQSMLMADPKDRLSLRQILAHPWVTSKELQRLDSLSPGCALSTIRRSSVGF